MKPITLTVAGLHSFREKQEVDFESLCSGGVFGIFGPTGSGKSSILDAMTLALYGKVERASNNTQGVMNHAENQLSVSFTFELSNAEETKRYRVERTFKRTDDIRMKTAICRLVEVGEETVVLADKANEVNDKIHELLGLTIDDFTRAVVLPQGKFAEFLSLKGSERRQMLQRLFHLEKYGDQLVKKLKHRIQEKTVRLQELTAEQTGLGDASNEALEQAEQQLHQNVKKLEEAQKEQEQFQKELEEATKLWEWQAERRELLKKQDVLNSKRLEMEKKEETLNEANEAERLKPYAEAVKDLTIEWKDYTAKSKQLAEKLIQTEEASTQFKQKFEHARKMRTEEEPKLLKRKEKLHHLQLLKTEMEKEEAEYDTLTADISKAEEALLRTSESRQKAENLLNRAIEKQNQLKGQWKEEQIPKEVRDQIKKAWQQKGEVVHLMSKWNDTKKQVSDKKQKFHQFKSQRESIANELQKSEQELAKHFLSVQNLYNTVCEWLREVERLEEAIQQEWSQRKTELEHLRVTEIAKKLTKELHEGEPCPVCGSIHHPNPQSIEGTSDDYEAAKKRSEQLEEVAQSIRNEKQQLETLKWKLEQLAESVMKDYPHVGEGVSQSAASVDSIDEGNTDLIRFFEQIVVERKGLEQDFLSVQKAFVQAYEKVREMNTKKQEIDPFIESLQRELEEWVEKEKNEHEEMKRMDEQWKQSFPLIDMEDVEKRLAEIEAKDKELEELQERIEKSVTFIEEQEQKTKVLWNEEHELKSQLSGKKVEQSMREQSLTKKKQQLMQEVDERTNLNDALTATEQEMTRLKEEEQTTYEAWQKASESLQAVREEVHSITKHLETTTEKLEKAKERFEAEKRSSIFQSIEHVLETILPENERQRLQNELNVFQNEWQEVSSTLIAIEEKLNGRELSEEEWTSFQMKKQTLQQAINELIAEKGAAMTQLNMLKEKHARFMEIEEEKSEVAKKLEQLTTLQSVFKGNSFVEYIAEEQLQQVSLDASERLGQLTRRRYAIEVDSQGGFIIRDDANGGVKRPVSTLSGGETFLTSLALALSLSAQIQLRGQYPLQFFFLDEGFGTLDVDLLDTVVTALEKLHSNNLSVGVISHVPELRARLPKRLVVEPAEPSGRGTRVKMETL